MSKKYLQILAFVILCLGSVGQEAQAQERVLPECCDACFIASGGKIVPGVNNDLSQIDASQGMPYAACIIQCSDKVCPTRGLPVSTEGQCGTCIKDHLREDKTIDFSPNSDYAHCIKKNNNQLICPDETTQPAIYQNLKS